MTQDRPDRLDRIEAALESLQQRLDSQVEVNASLRTSVETLRGSVEGLTSSVEGLTSSVEGLRVSTETLLRVVEIHQQNFEVLMPRERQRDEFERTTTAALDRISTVLDYLVRQSGNGASEEQPE